MCVRESVCVGVSMFLKFWKNFVSVRNEMKFEISGISWNVDGRRCNLVQKVGVTILLLDQKAKR